MACLTAARRAFHHICRNDHGDCRVKIDRLRHDKPWENVVKQMPIVSPKNLEERSRDRYELKAARSNGVRSFAKSNDLTVFVKASAAGDEAIIDENERMAGCNPNISPQMPCCLPTSLRTTDPD